MQPGPCRMQQDSWSAAVALSIGIDVADRG
jgi:hypothetical protein